MSDDQDTTSNKRDRSPAFPYVGLAKALQRVEQLYEKARHHEVRVADVAKDWGLTAKSSATIRTVAALLAFGLIEDNGSGEARKIKISDTGRRILDDKRPGVREELIAKAALRPKVFAEYRRLWGTPRLDDVHAISQLKFEGGFTDEGAEKFLRVYDETMRVLDEAGGFTNEAPSDNIIDNEMLVKPPAGTSESDKKTDTGSGVQQPNQQLGQKRTDLLMDGERELTTGLLSKNASFRLIVSGNVGVKEIERLISKLKLDKEILADSDETDDADEDVFS